MDWSFITGDATGIFETVVTAIAAYAALVILLRISGKRTLADMNAFDFIVTVALGSVLATTILSQSVSLVEGLVALATLVALQAIVASLAARSAAVRGAVKSEPTLLVRDGEILHDAMCRSRLSQAEIFAAIRASGRANVSEVAAVVLETNGDISVIGNASGNGARALEPA